MINYHVLNNSIVINFGGVTHNIHKQDSRYEPVLEAIRNEELDRIPELVDNKKKFNEYGLELCDGLVTLDGQQLPVELSNRVLEFVKQKLPKEPLLNFWRNLRDNPSYNSRQMLYKFLEHNGHPLTQDGCFIAYRGVTEDFKDHHTKTFDNSPGSICEMDRNLVDDNPNNTCSRGLHVASFDYANTFGRQKLVEVKVNPKDVVAVPTDYNGTKMRVCKFEVVRECDAILETEVYEHDTFDDIEETIVCPDCGEINDADALWCSDCGYMLDDTE